MKKNILYRIIIIAAALVMLLGCSDLTRLKDINVKSVSVASFTPTGLRSAKAGFNVKVDNPALGFTLSEISGAIYHKGKRIADYTADDISIERRTEKTYRLNGAATLSDGTSLTDLMNLAGSFNPDDITIDIHVRATTATKNKISRAFDYNNLPLGSLMGAANSLVQ